MATKWTPDQQSAIDAPKPGSRDSQTLLVAAAAGSGKTAVLVERILQKLQDEEKPLAIHELLVLTFTKAAAQEMKSRIGAKISETYAKTHSAYLEEQLNLLPSAHISTIHSFCQWLIQSYFYRLDLDPSLRVGSEGEMKLLEREVLETYLQEGYEQGSPEVLRLSARFNRKADDEALMDLVQSIYGFARAQEDPRVWLEDAVDQYRISEGVPLESQPWGRYFMERLRDELELCSMRLQLMLELLGRGEEWGNNLPAMATEYDTFVKQLKDVDTWDDMVDMLIGLEADFASYPRVVRPKKGNIPSEQDVETYLYLGNQNKEFFKRFWDGSSYHWQSVFTKNSEFWTEELKKQLPLMESLVKVVLDFDTAYQERKQVEGLIDFSDMEHMALALLTERVEFQEGKRVRIPSPVAEELRATFKAVMVDEYQDTNGVQEAIVNMVANKDNRFYVGDVKQSIYSFRAADPTLFQEKYESFAKALEAEERRIDLAKNFRSHENILEATNYIFAQIMSKEAAELNYGAEEALYVGKEIENPPEEWMGGSVELHLLTVPSRQQDSAPDDDEEESLSAIEQEAQFVVQKLKELKERGALVLDKNSSDSYHPIRWSDVVILLRSIRGSANVFVEALREAGIPAYAEDKTGYFETTEIQLLLSLLQVIDNPEQDLPLASVLRSPLVGLVGDELARLRLYLNNHEEEAKELGREPSFWWGLSHMVERATEEGTLEQLDPRLVRFVSQLESWRTYSRRASVSDLLWRVYEDTHFVEYVSAMTNGIARRANVLALYDRAKEFERGNFRGIFRFLRFIDSLRDAEEDMAPAQTVGASDDVVRIMSIHKSKGLEFPVVFLCGVGKRFNMMDLSGDTLYHKEAGLGILGYHETYRMTYPSLFWFYIRALKEQALKAEEERILYVALTRAKDKLYIVGNTSNVEKLAKRAIKVIDSTSQMVKIAKEHVWEESSYLGWLVKVLMRHPAGAEFRRLAGDIPLFTPKLPHVNSQWDITIYQEGTFMKKKREYPDITNVKLIENLQPRAVGNLPDEIIDRFFYEYPYQRSTETAAKISVSEIKRRFEEVEETADRLILREQHKEGERELLPIFAKKPKFIEEERVEEQGVKFGTLMHTVMQHLPIRYYNENYLKLALYGLKEDGLITKAEAKVIPVQRLLQFFKSDLGARMLAAYETDPSRVERELSFSLLLEGKTLDVELEEGEEVFLQGVVDLVFEEDGEWVLVDYKTDAVPEGEDARRFLKERYQIQLDVYAKALERITNKKVKQKFIYSFTYGQIAL